VTAHALDVVLVEDDDLVRAWLAASLSDTEFRISGEARSVESAIELLGRRRADLLLVDYHLGGATGLELVRRLRATGNLTPAILMTAHAATGMNEAAREAGAQASMIKQVARDAMLNQMRVVVRGGVGSFDPEHPKRPDGQRSLAPREREILGLIAAGLTNRQIAEELALSAETIKTYIERIYGKLGVHRRAEAVAEGTRRGLLPE